MRQILDQSIACLPAPLPLLTRDSLQYLRHPRIRRERRAQRRVLAKLPDPGRVAQGPFAGMSYVALSLGRCVLPKLLGTYECELYPAVEEIIGAGCDRIIDIGAAEGYYAVGLALRVPGASLTCFEIDPSVRYYLRRLARRNGVAARIRMAGECTPSALEAALAGAERPAIISDCEGAEDFLLDPGRVPSLRRATVLVETHDGAGWVEGLNRRLVDRFAPTHDIELIRSRPRTRDDLPAGCASSLTDAEADLAMDEHRRWAEWMFLRLKS